MWLEHRKQRPGGPKKPTGDVSLCPEGFGPHEVSEAERVSIVSALKRPSWSLGGVDAEGRLWRKVAAAGDESLDQVVGNGNREEDGFYGRQN